MLDHNEDCRYCGAIPGIYGRHPIRVQWNGFDGFAVECESCGARGPFGRDVLEAASKFEHPHQPMEADEC